MSSTYRRYIGEFLILMMLVVSSSQIRAADVNLAQAQVNNISTALSEDRIGRLEIVQMPARILTRSQVTPEMLEKQYRYKLIIRDVTAITFRGELINSFKSISVSPQSYSVDLRWGLIFYSRDNRRVGAIYFDKTGEHGSVNKDPSSFKGKFFSWLVATFSSCFQ